MTLWIQRSSPGSPAAGRGRRIGAPASQAAGGGFPLDHFPVQADRPGRAAERRQAVRQLLPELPQREPDALQPAADIGLTEAQIRATCCSRRPRSAIRCASRCRQRRQGVVRRAAARPQRDRPRRSSHAGSGSDWLYTYLRSYYRDATRATGWNNAVFPNVGMPHVLWELQGSRGADRGDQGGQGREDRASHRLHQTVVTFDAQGHRTEQVEKLDRTSSCTRAA
jgi:ubiquinol-cytochrome c reductase cytochrome c1 subunit